MMMMMIMTTFNDDDDSDDKSSDYMLCLDRHTKAQKTNNFKKRLMDLEGFEDLKTNTNRLKKILMDL